MFSLEYKQNLKLIAIATYIDIAFILYYFIYFPTIIDAQVTNILLIISIFIIVSLLVYGAFLIKTNIDLYYLFPQALFLTFIVRAVPNLLLQYPPLHDPYYYFSATENIIYYSTLTSNLTTWFPNIDRFLHWPIIHILTTILTYITNLSPMFFLRYQEPLLGIIFFIVIFLLAFSITKNNGISFLAAMFASFSDTIIFYQSEYHPQGFSLILFIIVIYLFIKCTAYNSYKIYYYLLLLVSIAFTLSHYFTPVMSSILLLAYIAVLFILRLASSLQIIPKQFNELLKKISLDYKYITIVILLPIIYEIIFYNYFIISASNLVETEPILNANLLSVTSSTIPILTSILSSFKWGLFLLAAISIIYILIDKNVNHFRLAVIIFCTIAAGIIGNYIIASPLDRLIAFYTPFAAIFASITLFRLKDKWFVFISKNQKIIASILVTSLIIVTGILNSQTPAYFFKESGINTYYWYSNDLSSMAYYQNTGNWIKEYTPNNSYYAIEFDTRILPFYYADRPYVNIKNFADLTNFNDVYTILNQYINYNNYNLHFDKYTYIRDNNILYNNGIITIGLR